MALTAHPYATVAHRVHCLFPAGALHLPYAHPRGGLRRFGAASPCPPADIRPQQRCRHVDGGPPGALHAEGGIRLAASISTMLQLVDDIRMTVTNNP